MSALEDQLKEEKIERPSNWKDEPKQALESELPRQWTLQMGFEETNRFCP